MESPVKHDSARARPWDGPGWPHRGTHTGAMTHLAMGIFLTLLGLVLTLDRLALVDAARALRWWPIGFYVLGATILLRRTGTHGRFWGVAWLLVGTWLLLNSLNLVRVGFWELVLPLLLMFIGVRLMMRGRRTPSGTIEALPNAPNLVAVMSEAKGSVTQALSRASMTAVMGGCQLDLRQASIQPGEDPVVDVLTVMGGLEIVAPSTWTVVLDIVTILAGAEDKRLPSVAGAASEQSAPRLTVRGTLILGGLTVKS